MSLSYYLAHLSEVDCFQSQILFSHYHCYQTHVDLVAVPQSCEQKCHLRSSLVEETVYTHISGYEESQAVSSVSSSSCAAGDVSFSFACFGSSACATSACGAELLWLVLLLVPLSAQLMLLPLHFVTELQ